MQGNSPTIVTLRMVWFAFAMSFFMFVGVIFFVGQNFEPKPEAIATIGPALGLMALLTLSSMPFARKVVMGAQTLPMLAEDPPSPWHQGLETDDPDALIASVMGRYQSALMIGMAICEATVLFGFVVAFLAQMPIIILPFAAAGLVGLAWQFPTDKSVQILARALAGTQTP